MHSIVYELLSHLRDEGGCSLVGWNTLYKKMISGQCENIIAFMIFKHFDGFSWFLGNVKISWFSNTLTVFHDFWAIWKSHDFQTLWRFFMISGQCENLMIFLYFLTVFHDFWAMWKSDDFLYFLTVFHDFWSMWKSHDFQTF
jgi:hypothetical protein